MEVDKRLGVKRVATQMAEEIGKVNMTRSALCKRAGISDGSWFFIMGVTFEVFMSALNAPDQPNGVIVTKRRLKVVERREQILAIAMDKAKQLGYKQVTRCDIAITAGISPALISYYFKTVDLLHINIMMCAVRREIPEVVAQGLADKNPIAITAPRELKVKAAESLL